jgi:hypothetical protein
MVEYFRERSAHGPVVVRSLPRLATATWQDFAAERHDPCRDGTTIGVFSPVGASDLAGFRCTRWAVGSAFPRTRPRSPSWECWWDPSDPRPRSSHSHAHGLRHSQSARLMHRNVRTTHSTNRRRAVGPSPCECHQSLQLYRLQVMFWGIILPEPRRTRPRRCCSNSRSVR